MTQSETLLTHGQLELDEASLHYVESGDGPPVVLLHGFPEFWYSWRNQIPFLAENGYRPIAPDLRGYNLSSSPFNVKSYRVHYLLEDVLELIEELCPTPPVLIGHDWGGIIAWRLAAIHPDRIRALVILNAPHPMAFRRELRRNPMQWLRSAYAGLFQLPWLPEKLLSVSNFAAIQMGLRWTAANPKAFTGEDLQQYADALQRSGLRGPLNYYRAARKFPGDLYDPPHDVSVKTMVIWGDRDIALSKQLAEELNRWVEDVSIVHIPQASHWVQHDDPEQVNDLIKEFLPQL
jgi:epoxide hydrolase 4